MTKFWLAPAVALSVILSVPALAMPSSSPPAAAAGSGGDFAAGEKAAKAGDYNQAVAQLEKVVQRDPNNAEAHNYLGYSLRKLGQYDRAGSHYRAALQLKPDFMEAIEYYGELFLATKDLPRAEEQLAKLQRLCPSGCAARTELES
ncbi:MAG: tetratricopeptide repeat protein, partial [Alphaproteobacteria bacterium]|nr:tetratricopeptide repeat protein [Alphaproteobacteria bacterium]